MHTQPLPDSAGDFGDWKSTKDEDPTFTCRKCGSGEVRYRVWDSDCGGFEDLQYRCDGCGRTWWTEGADA